MAARKSASRSSSSSSKRKQSNSKEDGGAALTTKDHDEIRRWAEERGGQPACVKGTRSGESCLLRIDFPGGAGSESLDPMSWDDFFQVLDERGLVFLYQDRKADGEQSTFNKLVSPDSVEEKGSRGRGRSSGKSGASARSSTKGGASGAKHGRRAK